MDPKLEQFKNDAYAEFVQAVAGPIEVNGVLQSDDQKSRLLTEADKDPFSQPMISQRFYQLANAEFGPFVTKKAQALHCEFEGARIRDVYNALDFGHTHCNKSGFWGFVCDVINFVIGLALAVPRLIAAAVAWAAADDGALSNSYDAAGGELKLDDLIVVQGRWCYDSAHSGYNEIHATRTVRQAVSTIPMDQLRNDWCSELSKIPPSPPSVPGVPPPTGGAPIMTPAQTQTRDAQARDENRWVYHPTIDGCIPQGDPNPRPAPGNGLH
jgi:hypothetical protein